MLATPPDAAGYLLVTRVVGLHYYLPPVETPPSRAPWLYLAREMETPFTPTVSSSIDARATPQMEMSVQRSASADGAAQRSVRPRGSQGTRGPGPLHAVVIRQSYGWNPFMTLPRARRLPLLYHQLGQGGADSFHRSGLAPAAP